MFLAIKAWYRQWKINRMWPAEDKVQRLVDQLEEDSRWLSHDKTASALCARYLDLLADDWYRRVAKPISGFRRELGLCPHHAKPEPAPVVTWQERVIAEKRELDERLSALSLFLESEAFLSVGDSEMMRLNAQESYMDLYSRVLGERIAAFQRKDVALQANA